MHFMKLLTKWLWGTWTDVPHKRSGFPDLNVLVSSYLQSGDWLRIVMLMFKICFNGLKGSLAFKPKGKKILRFQACWEHLEIPSLLGSRPMSGHHFQCHYQVQRWTHARPIWKLCPTSSKSHGIWSSAFIASFGKPRILNNNLAKHWLVANYHTNMCLLSKQF